MWWIILISIRVPVIIIGIFVVVKIVSKKDHDYDDYDEHGGVHVGIDEKPSFPILANDQAGIVGENEVNNFLSFLLRSDEYLLTNLLLPLWNGEKTEIDCVLISRKGIFCIEIKHWVGHISGNDEDESWLQEYDDSYRKNKWHRNPVKQNNGHCVILKKKLNNRYWINNVVIFHDLEDGLGINSKYTYTANEFGNYYSSLADVIPENSLKVIYQKLEPYIATPEELEKHREWIKRKYND